MKKEVISLNHRLIFNFLLIAGFIYFLLFNRPFVISYLLFYYIVSSAISLVQRKRLGRELLVLHCEDSTIYRKLFVFGFAFYLFNMIFLIYLVFVHRTPSLILSLVLGLITTVFILISYRTFRRRIVCEKGISGRECDNVQWEGLDSIYWNEPKECLVIFLKRSHQQKFFRRFILKVDEPVRNDLENLLRKIFIENKITTRIEKAS
jgi:hypothetical protein